jgi:hypothetical protein
MPNKKTSALDPAQAEATSTPRSARLSQSGIGLRHCEAHPLKDRRECLRNTTTCYVLDSQRFLRTFLPNVAEENVAKVEKALKSKKILKPTGWARFGQETNQKRRKAKTQTKEHIMFNKPLEEIVYNVIDALPHQGEFERSYATVQ